MQVFSARNSFFEMFPDQQVSSQRQKSFAALHGDASDFLDVHLDALPQQFLLRQFDRGIKRDGPCDFFLKSRRAFDAESEESLFRRQGFAGFRDDFIFLFSRRGQIGRDDSKDQSAEESDHDGLGASFGERRRVSGCGRVDLLSEFLLRRSDDKHGGGEGTAEGRECFSDLFLDVTKSMRFVFHGVDPGIGGEAKLILHRVQFIIDGVDRSGAFVGRPDLHGVVLDKKRIIPQTTLFLTTKMQQNGIAPFRNSILTAGGFMS